MALHWFTTYLTKKYSKNTTNGLDVGCGKKPYQKFFDCEYVGIDYQTSQMKAHNSKPDIYGTGEKLPFKDSSFDFLTSYSVIPYVEKIDDFLTELHRVMKPDSVAVIIIMNLKALSRDPNGNYHNKFSSRDLTKQLSNNGFSSIKWKNLKTLFWSTYFDYTSVYSYAIVKCKKQMPSNLTKSFIRRQKIRKEISKNKFSNLIFQKIFRLYCLLTYKLHVSPDFLIIGAAKSGTSSLYDYLIQHPSIEPSLTKQIHFFDRYFFRGEIWYRVCFPTIFKKFYFEKCKRQKFVTGESTPHYMTHPLAAERAFSKLPNLKIIVILRNPIDRAYSHYNMEKRNGNEKLSFEDAIKAEPERIKGELEEMRKNQNNNGRNYPHRAYLESGKYFDQIRNWMKFYPLENFHFINFEDLQNNPSETYFELLKFLNLPKFEIKKFEKIRKANYEKISPITREKLNDYFHAFNTQLYSYLGIDFEWS